MQSPPGIAFDLIRNVAAVGGILTAVIAFINFLRGRAKLSVTIERYPYEMPPAVLAVLQSGHRANDARQRLIGKGQEVPDTVAQVADAMAQLSAAGLDVYDRRPSDLWWLEVLNGGHEVIRDIDVFVPGAFSTLRKDAATTTAMPVADQIIRIVELRPDQRVRYMIWARSSASERPKVFLQKGRARVLERRMVSQVWWRASEVWRYQKWPLGLVAAILTWWGIRRYV